MKLHIKIHISLSNLRTIVNVLFAVLYKQYIGAVCYDRSVRDLPNVDEHNNNTLSHVEINNV